MRQDGSFQNEKQNRFVAYCSPFKNGYLQNMFGVLYMKGTLGYVCNNSMQMFKLNQ